VDGLQFEISNPVAAAINPQLPPSPNKASSLALLRTLQNLLTVRELRAALVTVTKMVRTARVDAVVHQMDQLAPVERTLRGTSQSLTLKVSMSP
jgi:hypothetical protein